MTTKPTLNLDDLIEPGAELIVNKTTYHFVRWSGLGLLQRHQIQKRYARIDELEKLPEPTDAHAAEYKLTVRDLLAEITDAPTDVLDSLSDEWRENVIAYFLALRTLTTKQRQEQMAKSLTPTDPATTGGSSRPSSATSPRPSRRRG